jgi:hypothetical protein
MSLLDLVEWSLETAELPEGYAKLELVSPYGVVPIAVVSLDEDQCLLCVGCEFTPWLPSSLVPLADPETGGPSGDGMCTGVCFVLAQSLIAAFLQPSGGSGWDLLGRWPRGGSLAAAASVLPSTVSAAEAVERGNSGLPIHGWSLTPKELDDILGGGFFSGPWGGYAVLEWPPREPDSEADVLVPLPFSEEAVGE